MKRPFNNSGKTPPRGFTLVELLVVIGLVVLLITMSVTVISGMVGNAKRTATKATITKVNSLLTARMEAFTIGLKAQPQLGGDSFSAVMLRKNAFKKGFPQTYQEAFPAEYKKDPTLEDNLASSKALYEFLNNGESFGSQAEGTESFSSNEVMTDPRDNKQYYVDGWGQPLRFYRWPTRLIRPSSADPPVGQTINSSPPPPYTIPIAPNNYYGTSGKGYDASLFFSSMPPLGELDKDPDDRLGELNASSSGPFATNRLNLANFERDYHTPETWSLPLIVSAGPDWADWKHGGLGLYEPNDKTNFGHLAQPRQSELDGLLDNLTNRNFTP